jgi:4-diphosphocytidyl-2-C-methyl-D-erythritol kinase
VLVASAPAKVNWTLEVVGRRADGYHAIATVLSTIDLCDDLTLAPAPAWSLMVLAPPPLRRALAAPDNLVARAALAFLAEAYPPSGAAPPPRTWPPPATAGPAARLRLRKRIPIAAGLGGGSSNAAATLRLLAAYHGRAGTEQFCLRPPHRPPSAAEARTRSAGDRDLLQRVAARLGSDVPFFVRGGTQLATGRGEVLRPLPDPPPRWLVLLTPPITLERKTERLYAMLDPAHFTDGARSHALAERLAAGGTVEEADLYNVFETVAAAAFAGLNAYRRRLAATVGAPAHLCGAGPTLFALAADAAAARRAAARLRSEGHTAWAVRTRAAEPAAAMGGTLPRT